jgi:acyl-CoA thioesterase I
VKRLVFLLILVTACVSAEAESAAILVFGDSISAGFGINPERGWVALLQAKLKKEGYGEAVVNASVSGETTEGGLVRLPRALALHHPGTVIIELGGNDGLRALPVEQMRANLAQMTALCKAAGARVLLLGMQIPPNYGPEYTQQFRLAYGAVARDQNVPLVTFLLDGIALNPGLMQADGIHPNELGQAKLLDNVWPALKPILRN